MRRFAVLREERNAVFVTPKQTLILIKHNMISCNWMGYSPIAIIAQKAYSIKTAFLYSTSNLIF